MVRHRLAVFTLIFTFIALMLGNLVTATGAKDACGNDWPLCDGKLIPDPTDPLQLIEYTHRFFTMGLGFLILINGILAIRKKKPGEGAVVPIAISSIILLIVQSLVGGLNVLLSTPPGFTTLDVVVSLLLLTSLIMLTVVLMRKPVTHVNPEILNQQQKYNKLYKPALLTTIGIYLEISLGAFFKHSAASQVLMGIELDASERLIHSLSLSELLYYAHGIVTFWIIIGVFWVVFMAMRERILIGFSMILLLFIGIETIMGFATYLTNLAVLSSSAHMLMASASMGVSAYITAKAGFGPYLLKKEMIKQEGGLSL